MGKVKRTYSEVFCLAEGAPVLSASVPYLLLLLKLEGLYPTSYVGIWLPSGNEVSSKLSPLSSDQEPPTVTWAASPSGTVQKGSLGSLQG